MSGTGHFTQIFREEHSQHSQYLLHLTLTKDRLTPVLSQNERSHWILLLFKTHPSQLMTELHRIYSIYVTAVGQIPLGFKLRSKTLLKFGFISFPEPSPDFKVK